MIAQCPRCLTKFRLDEGVVGEEGAEVRCGRCRHEFFLFPHDLVPGPARAPEPAAATPVRSRADDQAEDLAEELAASAPGRRRGLRLFLILLLLVVVLLAGVLFLKTKGVHLDRSLAGVDLYRLLPFLGPPEAARKAGDGGPPAAEPGNLKIHLFEVSGRFVALEGGGRLFVIQGRVRNDYQNPVSDIRLKGFLHTETKRNAVQKDFFAGHVFSDRELTSLPRPVIEGIISHPNVQENRPLVLAPGEFGDFMVVFYDLPEELTECTVEVVSSKSSK